MKLVRYTCSYTYIRYVKYETNSDKASMGFIGSYISGLTDAFCYMDTDNDGVVTTEDMHGMLDKNRDTHGEIRWVKFTDILSDVMKRGGVESTQLDAEYVNGVRDGFFVFADSLVSDLLRKLTVEFCEDCHNDGQISYTTFIRLVTENCESNQSF